MLVIAILSVLSRFAIRSLRKGELVQHLSKKVGKDQELIQSSTTPDQGYHMGK